MRTTDRSAASSSLVARAAASSSLTGTGRDERLIRGPRRVGVIACLVIAAALAALATTISVAEHLAGLEIRAGEPAPVTVRAPRFSGAVAGDWEITGGLVVTRGESPDPAVAEVAASIQSRHYQSWPRLAGLLAALGLLLVGWLRLGHRGRLLRFQLAIAATLVLWLAAAKTLLALAPLGVLALPAAALALIAARSIERRAGPIAGLVAGASLALLVPLDAGAIAVLAVQGTVAGLVVTRSTRAGPMIAAGVAGGLAAAAAALALSAPGLEDMSRSPILAAAAGGMVSGPLALALAPLVSRLAGEPSTRRLLALQDFSNTLLQDIAGRAPGTWQHSLAMANMVEAAVEAIGGHSELARTGAYYHDLGKSLQPKYFDENLAAGEPSPHEALAPELSAGVMIAHVTEGVRIGRQAGLPERVIDFMHMHHGGQRIEVPGGQSFRYPGVIPQSRETGALAICDAVEIAAGSLVRSDEPSIRALVQRVVYDKLHSGQLDESGLDRDDLRAIVDALCLTIRSGESPPLAETSRRDLETVALRKSSPEPATRLPSRTPAPPPAPEPTPTPTATVRGHGSNLEDHDGTVSLRRTQLGVEAPAQDDIAVTNPLAPFQPPPPPPGRRGPRTQQLSEWEEALEKVSDSGRMRGAPETIELLKSASDDLQIEPTSLAPGTLVIGPPPETHPGDHTVERSLPIPREGIRPSKRRTEPRPVVVPPEAFPDDTVPSASTSFPGSDED